VFANGVGLTKGRGYAAPKGKKGLKTREEKTEEETQKAGGGRTESLSR
jgi:hypothetical protein